MNFKKLMSFFRWRIKQIRQLTKLINILQDLPKRIISSRLSTEVIDSKMHELKLNGYCKLSTALSFSPINIDKLSGIAGKKSFVDVGRQFPSEMRYAFSQLMNVPGVQNLLINYFDGRPWLWNVAINYSDPSGELNDSQLWHFDYGDTRQLHFMLYFTEVDEHSGPFTFLDAITSSKIKRSPFIIERMTDEELQQNYAINVKKAAIRLTGSQGDIFVADPGRVMHQGARCSKPRLVMFVTFTSPEPMSRGGALTMDKELRKMLWESYQADCMKMLNKDVFL